MEIRPFEPDYKALSRLIAQSWAVEHESRIDFSEAYLKHLIDAPDTDWESTLAAYSKGTLIGFLLSKEKTVIIRGKPYKGLQQTLASTHPDFASQFPYIRVKDASIKKAVDRGYELNFGFVASGIKNNRIERLFSEKKGFQCTLVRSFGWLGYAPTKAGLERERDDTNDVRISAFHPDDADRCLNIMEQASARCPVFLKWDMASFLSRLSDPEFCTAKTVRIDGEIQGFVCISNLGLVYKHLRRKVFFLYHLFLDVLPEPVKKAVICSIMDEMKAKEAQGISVPDTGYFDAGFLKRMGFKEPPFKKYQTNLYITSFKGGIPFDPDTPFYLDII